MGIGVLYLTIVTSYFLQGRYSLKILTNIREAWQLHVPLLTSLPLEA